MATATQYVAAEEGIYIQLHESYAADLEALREAIKLEKIQEKRLRNANKEIFDAAKAAQKKADDILRHNQTLKDHIKDKNAKLDIFREAFGDPDVGQRIFAEIPGAGVIKKHTYRPRIELVKEVK